MQCKVCGYKSLRRHSSNIISFPFTMADFHPLNAKYSKSCQKCKAENQIVYMTPEKLVTNVKFFYECQKWFHRLILCDMLQITSVLGDAFSTWLASQYLSDVGFRNSGTSVYYRCGNTIYHLSMQAFRSVDT